MRRADRSIDDFVSNHRRALLVALSALWVIAVVLVLLDHDRAPRLDGITLEELQR